MLVALPNSRLTKLQRTYDNFFPGTQDSRRLVLPFNTTFNVSVYFRNLDNVILRAARRPRRLVTPLGSGLQNAILERVFPIETQEVTSQVGHGPPQQKLASLVTSWVGVQLAGLPKGALMHQRVMLAEVAFWALALHAYYRKTNLDAEINDCVQVVPPLNGALHHARYLRVQLTESIKDAQRLFRQEGIGVYDFGE